MAMKYNKRTWLNKKNNASTGSIVCYYGKKFYKGKGKTAFIEVADCHQSVRLHKCDKDSLKDFIEKVRKLEDDIVEFRKFLEQL